MKNKKGDIPLNPIETVKKKNEKYIKLKAIKR